MKPIDTLLLLCFALRTAGFVPKDRAGNGDLAEVIKLNLRKNNDDYTDTQASKLETTTASAMTTTFPTYSKISKLGLRRANIIVESEMSDDNLMYELEQNIIGHNLTHKFENWKITPVIEDSNLKRLFKKNQPRTTPMRARFSSNRSKIEKFQRYFEKNKDLFKEFLSSKIAARTQGLFGRKGPNSNTKGLRVDLNREAAQERGWLDGDESGGTTEPLDPDRLDMLPAVGGRIHYWRLRGRLCHRHVVMPEGPKYDSKGRVYLPAHGESVLRPYNVTRRPHLLLPKCCNCCKKSVLGCE